MTIEELHESGRAAQKAAAFLATLSSEEKNAILLSLKELLLAKADKLIGENKKDLAGAEEAGLSGAMKERLTLTKARIASMAEGVAALTALPDPTGLTLEERTLPNGLRIVKKSVSFGVVAMIYESRPNVTIDAAALCLKSGNASILRGGKEAHYTNAALTDVIHEALALYRVPAEAVTSILDPDRALVDTLLTMRGEIDLVIPRGGAGLIRFVVEHSTVPVIETGSGVCHTYIDKDADMDKAIAIAVNAKVQRPSVCNAMETLLVHRDRAEECARRLFPVLKEKGVEIRGDELFLSLDPSIKEAAPSDWSTEYNDLILSVRAVSSLEDALAHIARYGTHHSECIVSENKKAIDTFMASVDAAAVYANASTRFTDGFEFGFGAEIGISTQKLHVRGPMGLPALTTYKYEIFGNGQIRQ